MTEPVLLGLKARLRSIIHRPKTVEKTVTMGKEYGVCPEAYSGQHVSSASVGMQACLLCSQLLKRSDGS